MHTYISKKGTTFHFNSDYTGEVIIVKDEDTKEIKIPCEDILEFVAEHIRDIKIRLIEQADWRNIYKTLIVNKE